MLSRRAHFSPRLGRHYRPVQSLLTNESNGTNDPTLTRIPLFPLSSVLLPSGTGRLHVHEPRYLSMFRRLQLEQATSPGKPVLFGHIISESPPGLATGSDRYGLPDVGTAASVQSLYSLGAGEKMEVQYEGSRRFRLLGVEESTEHMGAVPYLIGVVTWLEDEPPSAPSLQAELDARERAAWDAAQQVQSLLLRLQGERAGPDDVAAMLPATVVRLAPPPEAVEEPIDRIVKKLHSLNYPAARDIEIWRGARRPGSPGGRRRSGNGGDPYAAAATELNGMGWRERQEMFSFALTQMVDAGPIERLALMQSRDTEARLSWFLSCIVPYLDQLKAQVSINSAFQPDV